MIKQFMNRQWMPEKGATDQFRVVRKSQKGASAIEYVMIIAVIVLAVVIAFNTTNLGPWITDTFDSLTGELQDAGPD